MINIHSHLSKKYKINPPTYYDVIQCVKNPGKEYIIIDKLGIWIFSYHNNKQLMKKVFRRCYYERISFLLGFTNLEEYIYNVKHAVKHNGKYFGLNLKYVKY